MSTRTHLATLLFVCLAYAPDAHAHICMEAPVSRVGPSCTSASPQKPGPCGINMRSTKYVTELKPGATITVSLNETINHDSHYRIAFNPNGAEFEDPTSKDDKMGKHPFVLLDGIMDESAAKQSVQVTLPNITCDNCTLQLIQVMYDKGGNGFGNDDIYYSCADLVLKGTPAAGSDAGVADGGSSIVAPGDGGAQRPAPFDAGSSSDAGTAGGGGDAGSTAPSPVPEAGGGTQGAGGSTGGDGGNPVGGSLGGDAGATDGMEDEADDGGCSLTRRRARPTTPLAALLSLGVAALLIRRRQRR
jgi:hypothetical protein